MATPPLLPDTELPSINVSSPRAIRPLGDVRRFFLRTMAGDSVLTWEGTLSYDYNNQSYVIDDPIEGDFVSRDKARSPSSYNVQVITVDKDLRENFKNEAEAAVDGIELYQLITPDGVHDNLAIVGVNGFKTPDDFYNAVGMTIKLREVRLNNQTRIDQTAQPNAAKQVHGGQVTGTEK